MMVYKKLFFTLMITSVLGNAFQGFAMENPYANANEMELRQSRISHAASSAARNSERGWCDSHFDDNDVPADASIGAPADAPDVKILHYDGELKVLNGGTLRPTTFVEAPPKCYKNLSRVPASFRSWLSQNKKKFCAALTTVVVIGAGAGFMVWFTSRSGGVSGAGVRNNRTLAENDFTPNSTWKTINPTPLSTFWDTPTTTSKTFFNNRSFLNIEWESEYYKWSISRFTALGDLVRNIAEDCLENVHLALAVDPNAAKNMTSENYLDITNRILQNQSKIEQFMTESRIDHKRYSPETKLVLLRTFFRDKNNPRVRAWLSAKEEDATRSRRDTDFVSKFFETAQEKSHAASKLHRQQQERAKSWGGALLNMFGF